MKNLILISVLLVLSGCASNPFTTNHLERIVCDSGHSTPWALYTERYEDVITWSTAKWRRNGRRDIPANAKCVKQVMSKERLAAYN